MKASKHDCIVAISAAGLLESFMDSIGAAGIDDVTDEQARDYCELLRAGSINETVYTCDPVKARDCRAIHCYWKLSRAIPPRNCTKTTNRAWAWTDKNGEPIETACTCG